MKIVKNKITAIIISIFLVLSMTTSLALIPNVRATIGLDIITFGFISAGPSPVGVGQTEHLNFWVHKPTPTANGAYGDRWQILRLRLLSLMGPPRFWGLSQLTIQEEPTLLTCPPEAGNYSFEFSFPGQTIAGANPAPTGTSDAAAIGTYFEPCTSSPVYVPFSNTDTELSVNSFTNNLLADSGIRDEHWLVGHKRQLAFNWACVDLTMPTMPAKTSTLHNCSNDCSHNVDKTIRYRRINRR